MDIWRVTSWVLLLLLTLSLYLVPFSRYSILKFFGFDLDLWPLEVTWVKNISAIRKPIHDFLSNFYWHFLSISYRFRENSGQNFSGQTKWRIFTFSRSRSLTDTASNDVLRVKIGSAVFAAPSSKSVKSCKKKDEPLYVGYVYLRPGKFFRN